MSTHQVILIAALSVSLSIATSIITVRMLFDSRFSKLKEYQSTLQEWTKSLNEYEKILNTHGMNLMKQAANAKADLDAAKILHDSVRRFYQSPI